MQVPAYTATNIRASFCGAQNANRRRGLTL
jgi:hypothetical protein